MLKKTLILATLSSSIFANTISFSQAYNLTMQNNHELKAKKVSINNAQLDVSTADGYNYGTLIFNENIARSNNALVVFGMKLMSREADFGDFGFNTADFGALNQMMQGGEEIADVQPNDLNNPGFRNNFETKLTYELPIFTGFKLTSAKDMASLQVKASRAKYTYDKKQLGLEVLKAYNGAVAARYFIEATKDAKKATLSFVNFASEMYKEGYVTSIDVKQAQVYDMKINSMLLEAKNKHSLAIAYLKFLTSNDKITDVKDYMNINIDSENIKLNVTNRDDYKYMRANTQTMKKKIAFEKSAAYPMIGTHFEYGFNDNKLNNIDSSKDYVTIAIGLEYKIFDGAKTNNDVKKAKLEYIKTNHYLQHMRNGIKLQVQKATLTLKTKKSVLKEKLNASNMEKEILEQSNEMYKNQLLKMSDLLMQEAKTQKAKAEAIMAKYDVTIAAAKLKLSLGESILENNNSNDLMIDPIKVDKLPIKNIPKIADININYNYIVAIKIANVREEPKLNANIVRKLKYKTKLNISNCNKYKWCQIENKDEYISLKLLKKLSK